MQDLQPIIEDAFDRRADINITHGCSCCIG